MNWISFYARVGGGGGGGKEENKETKQPTIFVEFSPQIDIYANGFNQNHIELFIRLNCSIKFRWLIVKWKKEK